jgi:hypothetical protein
MRGKLFVQATQVRKCVAEGIIRFTACGSMFTVQDVIRLIEMYLINRDNTVIFIRWYRMGGYVSASNVLYTD